MYIVDVCGTLVRDDTTLGLLKYHFSLDKNLKFRLFVLRAMTARHSPLRLLFALVEKLTGKHFLKHFAVRTLAGVRVDAFEQSAKEYACFLLANRRVESVWILLPSSVKFGHVVLASASLDPIVAAIGSAIGARHVASKLEEERGVLTGRFLNDLTGGKEDALLEMYGKSFFDSKVCAISDNPSDRSLLEKATQAYVVLHHESHRKRWRGIEATFLGIDE